MNLQPIGKNNRLIRRVMLKAYPSSFAATLTVSIALMVDTILAGSMISQAAIASVAIGLPAIGIFQALTQMVISGSAVKLAVYAGRGEQKQMNRVYSLGMAATVVLGLVFMTICLVLADQLTMVFGGAGNPEAAHQAAIYLRASSVCILMGSLNTFAGKALTQYGHQDALFRSALIAVIGNIVFSTLYIHLLPDQYAIAGLGAGTWTGGLLACTCSLLTIRARKIPLRFRWKDVSVKELPEMVRLGVPSSGNNLADGLVSGVVNNIIVAGFGGSTVALSIYTAVKGVVSFGISAIQATMVSAAPLIGVLYGARDRNGILRTLKEGLKVGIVMVVIWCGILVALLPFLAGFYGMKGVPQFQAGVLFCFCFMPLLLLMRLFTQLFESTEKTGMGLLYSILPDSVIYPVMLAVLLPVLGYNGIWLAYSANAIPFLILLYLVRSAKNKSGRLTMDRMLCLDESIRDNVPMLDISIKADNTDVTGISRQVHEFLNEEKVSGRTAYITALCLEELAADFVAHSEVESDKRPDQNIMDIKLFSDEDALRVVIRNVAPAYDPLTFQLDDNTFSKVGVKLAQKVARQISYTYVYKMNIVTIDVDK